MPGINIPVHFKPEKVGRYEIACAELCGQLHYKMRSFLLVLPEDEYRDLTALSQSQFQTRISELIKKYPIEITKGRQ